MIRRKSTAALAVAGMMALFCLAGCGGQDTADDAGAGTAAGTQSTQSTQETQATQSTQPAQAQPSSGAAQNGNGGNSQHNGNGQHHAGGTTDIGMDQAIAIAVERVPGATASNVTEIERDYDDGWLKYEGSIWYGGYEYEFEIDAATGNLLKWEIDD